MMFGIFKKLFLGAGFAAFIGLAMPALAIDTSVKAQNTEDFLRASGQTKYANILAKKENDAQFIVCGNEENVCNKSTQICLLCQYTATYKTMGQAQRDFTPNKQEKVQETICANKNSTLSPTELWKATKGSACGAEGHGLSTMGAGVLIKSEDFLTEGVYKTWFITQYKSHEFKANGKTYKLVMSKKPTIVYGGKGDFNGCEVFPVKYYNTQGCFFCPLAAVIFSTSNDVTINSFSVFASSFRIVLVVAFAIWLALLALRQVFAFTKQDAPKFLTAIIKQGFKVGLAFLLLAYGNDLFRAFIIPVLDSGLVMGKEIQSATTVPAPVNFTQSKVTTASQYYNLPIKSTLFKEQDTGEVTLFRNIEYYMASIQSQLAYMQTIGSSMACVGAHHIIPKGLNVLESLKEGLLIMVLGGFLFVFAIILTISFGFYFLDAILQLAIIGAMLPFMIAGWPLRVTAQYASTGFKLLLNTFFVMFFTGFVVAVALELVDQSLSFSSQNTVLNSGLTGIANALNNQDFASILRSANIGFTGYLLLAFACIFGFKFIAQAVPLAGKLSQGGISGLAPKIGTMGYSAVKGFTNKAVQPVAQGVASATGGPLGLAARAGGGVVSLGGSIVGFVGEKAAAAGDKLSKKKGGKVIGKALKAVGVGAQYTGKAAKAVGNAGKRIQDIEKRNFSKIGKR
jgi:hypothetical protein